MTLDLNLKANLDPGVYLGHPAQGHVQGQRMVEQVEVGLDL